MTDNHTNGAPRAEGAGSKQHILPAALIGQFSEGGRKRFRYRKVFVRRRSGGLPVLRAANRLAWQSDYYGPHAPAAGELDVDSVWTGTESGLPKAIEDLQENEAGAPLSLRHWLWVLVPFVASLFARGVDFESRFDERMRQMLSEDTYDELFPSGERRRANTNRARLIEVVRLLAPVMRASWRIMHNLTSTPLVLNDRGFALYQLSATESFYGLPLTPRLMVLLRAGLPAPSVDYQTAQVAGIEHYVMSLADVESANRGTFGMASSEVYGPNAEGLTALGDWPPAQTLQYVQLIGADALIKPGFDLRFHESDWLEVIGRFRAKQNYLPKDTGLPVHIRVDLPMLSTQSYFLSQLALEMAEVSLRDGRGEVALDHCAAAAERNPEAVADWLGQRLSLVRFGRRRAKTVEEVAQHSTALLESGDATAYETCAAALNLALITAGQGRHGEARGLLQRVAVTSKDYDLAITRGAVLMQAIGDREGAVEALKGVAESHGDHFGEVAGRIGELLAEDGSQEAEQWLRAASTSGDSEWAARALFRLANLLRERGDGSLAAELYARAEATRDPRWGAAAAYNHGVYLMETGGRPAALRLWRKGFASSDSYWKAHCANTLGGHFFSVARFVQARPYLEFAAISRLPDIKHAAALNLGVVLSMSAEYDSARYWLDQVVAEAEGDLPARARLALADVAAREGNRELAISHLRAVSAGKTEQLGAEALLRWGRLTEQTDAGEAASLYERAIELAQAGPSEAAAVQLATLVCDQGDVERALALSKGAVDSLDPTTSAKANNLAGISSSRLGAHEEAIEFYRQAADSADHRQSVIGQANLGGMLVDNGQVEDGIKLLRRAKGGGGPGAVFAALNLAEYQTKRGRSHEAEREYKWAIGAQAGRYRTQAAVPYAQFLASLGRIREARQLIDSVVGSAGPKMRLQLISVAEELKGASEGVARSVSMESALHVENEDERRASPSPADGQLDNRMIIGRSH